MSLCSVESHLPDDRIEHSMVCVFACVLVDRVLARQGFGLMR
ncbi:hypothetical protein [Marinomonas sp.]